MPNWCQNELFIYGMPEDVADLVVFVQSPNQSMVFDFENILPILEEWDPEGLYDWCTVNWGTKWNLEANAEIIERTLDSVCYAFDTAWSPAIPVVYALQAKYPDLHFIYKYAELGNNFAGELIDGAHKEGEIKDFAWTKNWYPEFES